MNRGPGTGGLPSGTPTTQARRQGCARSRPGAVCAPGLAGTAAASRGCHRLTQLAAGLAARESACCPAVTAGAFLLGLPHDQASPSISAAFLFGLIPSPLIPWGHISPSSGQTMLLALIASQVLPEPVPSCPRLPNFQLHKPDGLKQATCLSEVEAASCERGR